MLRRLGMALFCGTCLFAGGVVGGLLQSHLLSPAVAQPASPRPAPQPIATAAIPTPAGPSTAQLGQALSVLSDRFESAYRVAGPAVVAIEAVKPPSPGKTRPVEESGSGVLFQADGQRGSLVLTNNHVISGARSEQITIALADGRVFRAAQVWADPESDIAVLRIETSGLPVAKLGDSDRVRVGEWVVAIGSPFGLSQSVTHGIISARERGQVSLGSTIRIKDFLQTDAAINPGSSGGPLLNLDAEVIGINTAIASQTGSNSGVAFSIPINLVKRVVRQLLDKGSVSRGYLGVQLAPVLEPAEALRLGLDRSRGALIETVQVGSPAAAAGLKANDVILQVDEVAIRNENHLINLISSYPPGKRIRISLWRDRRSQSIDAIIGDWNEAQTRSQSR